MSDVINAVMAQYDANTKPANKKAKVSDEERLKRYFSTQLPKNKESGQKTFRILPPKNGKSPFVEVWFHEIKVGSDWVKLYCPNKNKTGDCPLCEIEKSLRGTGKKEDKDIASQYSARKFYIVKGIDRDHEEDGPKFWRFRHNYKKQGTLDKFVPVFSAKGDITDVEKGRDIILALGRDDSGYTKVTTIMPEDPGPLHEDPELVELWVNNEMTWEDVYAKKSYEYLDIVAQGEIPYWDKDEEKFITKTEWELKNNNDVTVETMDDDGQSTATIGGRKKEQTKSELAEEEKTVVKSTTTKTKASAKVPVKPAVKKAEIVDEDNDESDVEMDDLPF